MKKEFTEPTILLKRLGENVILTSAVSVDWNDEWGDDWDPYDTN